MNKYTRRGKRARKMLENTNIPIIGQDPPPKQQVNVGVSMTETMVVLKLGEMRLHFPPEMADGVGSMLKEAAAIVAAKVAAEAEKVIEVDERVRDCAHPSSGGEPPTCDACGAMMASPVVPA